MVRLVFILLTAAPVAYLLPTPLLAQELLDLASFGYDLGDPDAPIRVVEFGDFGCSACAEFARDTWAGFRSEFVETGIVTWKFIPFVLGTFRNSEEAVATALCVVDLDPDSFWSIHDDLYLRQQHWNGRRRPKKQLRELAEGVGVNGAAFEDCFDGGAFEERTRRNNAAAKRMGVRATPTFFVNGRAVVGALPLDAWRQIIMEIRGGGSD